MKTKEIIKTKNETNKFRAIIYFLAWKAEFLQFLAALHLSHQTHLSKRQFRQRVLISISFLASCDTFETTEKQIKKINANQATNHCNKFFSFEGQENIFICGAETENIAVQLPKQFNSKRPRPRLHGPRQLSHCCWLSRSPF